MLSERLYQERAPPDQLSIPFDILSWAKVIRREFTQCPLKLHRIFPTLISSHLLDCWYKIRVTTSLKFPVFFFRNVRVGALKGNSALVYTKLIYCLPKFWYYYLAFKSIFSPLKAEHLLMMKNCLTWPSIVTLVPFFCYCFTSTLQHFGRLFYIFYYHK